MGATAATATPGHYLTDIVPLGDFNLPKAAPGDRIFDALVSLGLEVPPHSSQIGSAIASDSYYDQIAFFPGTTQARFTGASNVFDFDGALFQDLWQTRPRQAVPQLPALPPLGPSPAVGGVPDELRGDGRSWIRTTDLRLIRAAL